MPDTLYMRVMTQAAEVAGGIESLAQRLGGLSPLTVRAFITGAVRPPDDVFYRAYSVIHGEDLSPPATPWLDKT